MSLLRRFLARFRPGARPAGRASHGPDRFDQLDAEDVPKPDSRVWKHRGASRGPFGIGGWN
ncbi:hypothetical protein ABT095_07190 [Kitasatospora sp. NPDC002227]|uniref:hypothetical protein n=1 Tax=Kitasatospora sp. NPDC002227 TaxID=3154773 RepID=UPI003316BB17